MITARLKKKESSNDVGILATSLMVLLLASCGDGNSGPPPSYTIGGSVSGLSGSGLVLLDNGGDRLAVSANGSFTFATAVSGGMAYAVTVGTQPSGPSQYCSVNNGTGKTSANVTAIAISCQTVSRFAYATDFLGNTVSGFAIDPGTGALTALATSPYAAGNHPQGAVALGSQFLYVANESSNNVSGYAIDANSGALTELSDSPYAADTGPGAIVLTPNGKFLYVANGNGNDFSAYTVNATTGALRPIAGSPFIHDTPSLPYGLAIDSSGKYLYVADLNPGAM
jgi:6-phosphogluconolactonase